MELLKEYLLKTQMKETDFEDVTDKSVLNQCISNCLARRCKIRLICAVSPTAKNIQHSQNALEVTLLIINHLSFKVLFWDQADNRPV